MRYLSLDFYYKNKCLNASHNVYPTYDDALRAFAIWINEYLDRPINKQNIYKVTLSLWDINENWIKDNIIKTMVLYEEENNTFFSREYKF